MKRVDVVVLGGGLVGCAAAYYLARAGASVQLLDRADINREASGRNAGSLHFQLEYRLVRYGDAQAAQFAQIIPLSLVAMEDWRGLEGQLQADLEVGMHGGLIVAESPADVERLEKRQALHVRCGLATQLLAKREVHALAPYLSDTVIAASYFADEGHANPRLVTPAFARSAAALGAVIESYTRATSLVRDGRDWRVTAVSRDGGTHEIAARAVLNAAGAWAADVAALAHLHLPIYAIPLTMNVIERCAPLIPHLVQHASERLTVKQVAAGNVLVGGGWPSRFPRQGAKHSLRLDCPRTCAAQTMETHGTPEPVISNILENLMLATRLIPTLGQLHLLRSWTGTTGVTADQMPLLGEAPEAPGFYVAAGGAAFTHGPTYARLISELILEGRTSAAIDLYSPARFSHVNGFMASV
ncbi:MAG: FAD-binding oxidoreductase [Gammaproteobacteria bacterium]